MIIAPCGFQVDRTFEELHLLTKKEGWSNLQAVKSGNVSVVNFELFTQSSASTLVDGIELLAGLFHPDAIEIPDPLIQKYRQVPTEVFQTVEV